jgi:alpha-L-fucosidase
MVAKRLSDAEVRQLADKTRARRLKWFQDARFGMFVHWGAYAVHGRGEWAMNQERMPIPEYEKLADAWKPKARPMRDWARLAVDAGMKYMVLTTKHHDGFCLWDTAQTSYSSVRRGPLRDLVREYVETCREHGLKVGLYYSLLDWHHPDGARCAVDK